MLSIDNIDSLQRLYADLLEFQCEAQSTVGNASLNTEQLAIRLDSGLARRISYAKAPVGTVQMISKISQASHSVQGRLLLLLSDGLFICRTITTFTREL